MGLLLHLRNGTHSAAEAFASVVQSARAVRASPQVAMTQEPSLAVSPCATVQPCSPATSSQSTSKVAGVAGGALAVLAARGTASRRRHSLRSRTAAGSGDGEVPAAPLETSPEEGEQKKGKLEKLIDRLKNDPNLQEDLKTFFTSLTVALFIRAIFVEPRFIPSLSMYPSFDVGDQLTVDKISKNWRAYQRRDVVVFNPPDSFYKVAGQDRNGEALIKRIVALAGDTVEIKDGGHLYINGEFQEETFTNELARYNFGPVTVPPGNVFVLGDNRNASLDGHIWGFLPVENIIGRATLKFWPPWHVGTVVAAPP